MSTKQNNLMNFLVPPDDRHLFLGDEKCILAEFYITLPLVTSSKSYCAIDRVIHFTSTYLDE